MMRLIGAPISPFSMRVAMQIAAKGLDIPMIPPPGGVHSPEYLAIAPIGKIPVLEHDAGTLAESEVICEFLEDLFPNPALRPEEPLARAQVRLASRILDTYVMNPMLPLFANLDPKRRDTAVVERALESMKNGLNWLEVVVKPGRYVVGSTLSLADCAAVPILLFVEKFLPAFDLAQPFADLPAVASYWRAIADDACAADTMALIRDALAKL